MLESKKVVIKVDFHDDNDKRKVLKAVSSLLGIDNVVGKLKKWHTDILTVGPAKEQIPQKPKDGGKKNGNDAKGGFICFYPVEDYNAYNPYLTPCLVHSAEDDPWVVLFCKREDALVDNDLGLTLGW